MKHRTRIAALFLTCALFLSIAACSDETGGPDPSPSVQPSASGSGPDLTAEDLCLAITGIPGDFELYTVNGVPVTARAYLYWLAAVQQSFSYGGEIDWTITTPDGSSMADFLKAQARDRATTYAMPAIKAKELGYSLSQEQIDELESALALSIESMGGEEAYQEQLRQLGLDHDTFYNLNAAAYYYSVLLDSLFGAPSEEDMAAYIQENDLLAAKHILLMTVDSATREPLDEETVAAKKAAAESLLDQLQNSADPAAEFDALMFANSEDGGLTSNPNGYIFTAGQMVAPFEEGTRALEYGQISGLVESEYGYHIILRLNPMDMEDFRAQYRYDALDAQLYAWIDEADVVLTDEYQALDVQSFCEKYTAYQEAFSQQDGPADDSEGDAGDVSVD